jgi:hypothetical protein
VASQWVGCGLAKPQWWPSEGLMVTICCAVVVWQRVDGGSMVVRWRTGCGLVLAQCRSGDGLVEVQYVD